MKTIINFTNFKKMAILGLFTLYNCSYTIPMKINHMKWISFKDNNKFTLKEVEAINTWAKKRSIGTSPKNHNTEDVNDNLRKMTIQDSKSNDNNLSCNNDNVDSINELDDRGEKNIETDKNKDIKDHNVVQDSKSNDNNLSCNNAEIDSINRFLKDKGEKNIKIDKNKDVKDHNVIQDSKSNDNDISFKIDLESICIFLKENNVNDEHLNDICCICQTDNLSYKRQLIKLKCCGKCIHKKCYTETSLRSASECPNCRSKLLIDNISQKLVDKKWKQSYYNLIPMKKSNNFILR